MTIIIVTFAVLILFPIGAWAVSGSNVFVTDATSGKRAAVIGSGALTVAEASPYNFFHKFVDADSGGNKVFVTPPAGKAAIVTSINVDVFGVTGSGIGRNIVISVSRTNATCAVIDFNTAADVNPDDVGETVIPLHPGLVVPAGRSLCVRNNDTVNLGAEVYAYGYYVASSAAPTGSIATSGSVETPGGRNR